MTRTTLLGTVVFAATTLGAGLSAQAQSVTEWVTGIDKPVDMVADPEAPNRFYVAEQKSGAIRVIEDGKLLDKPFLVIESSSLVSRGWEQGLLGLEFSPNYATDKHIYVNYTGRGDDGTYTYITRFTATDAYSAAPSSEHVVIGVKQPYGNHNCGNLRFGPDGYLYVGMGDGGAANDPLEAGQDLSNILATIIRIDVNGDDFPDDDNANYSVPKDNPFVANDDARPEIFAWGIRNPWGMEFDSEGNLWFADVGQNRFEEVNIIPAGSGGGQNFGWNTLEGMHTFKPRRPGSLDLPDPAKVSAEEQRSSGFEPPVFQYRHHPEETRQRMGSITGGFLYEGSKVPALKGRYICADFMSGRVWSFKLDGDKADDVVDHTAAFSAGFPKGPQLSMSAFARDHDDELFLVDHRGGRILKIVQ